MSNITIHKFTVRLQNSKQTLQSIELFRVPNTQTIRIRDTKTLRVSESPASAFVTAGNFIRYTAPNGRVYLLQAEKPVPGK